MIVKYLIEQSCGFENILDKAEEDYDTDRVYFTLIHITSIDSYK